MLLLAVSDFGGAWSSTGHISLELTGTVAYSSVAVRGRDAAVRLAGQRNPGTGDRNRGCSVRDGSMVRQAKKATNRRGHPFFFFPSAGQQASGLHGGWTGGYGGPGSISSLARTCWEATLALGSPGS